MPPTCTLPSEPSPSLPPATQELLLEATKADRDEIKANLVACTAHLDEANAREEQLRASLQSTNLTILQLKEGGAAYKAKVGRVWRRSLCLGSHSATLKGGQHQRYQGQGNLGVTKLGDTLVCC
jgi:hypothetical protein